METILTSPLLQWFANNNSWLQIIPLVCGVTYMTLQIFQHKWMWYFSILTSVAALAIAVTNLDGEAWAPLWAQVVLNAYLIVIAISGIIRWRKLDSESDGRIHIVKMSKKRIITVLVAVAIANPIATWLLGFTSDPAPALDGISLVLSFVAAWLLSRSHIEQYLFWIAANALIIAVYASQGMWLMAAMYTFYIGTCIVGFINWKKNGVVVE